MNKLEKIYEKTAAIDIGSEKVFVSAEGSEIRNFRTFTSSYRELGAYLKDLGIVKVAMESTGVYWVVLYDILEEMGFDLTLVNPSQVKNLPGRKTDVQDCQWIQKLFSYGLLSKSFVPTDYIRKLRVFTRLREDKLRMSSSHINHMQKALVQMNIRLPEVLSQIHGVSGMAMIEAILEGERNPKTLLNLCTSDLKKRKGEEILLALEGNYKEEYLFELRQAYEGFMFYKQQIASCDLEAEKLLNEMNSKIGTGFTDDKPEKAIRHNRPKIENLHQTLISIQGVNPTVLPGITDYSFLRLTAEVGIDLSNWRSKKAFTSWLGLSPGKNQSGKMNKRSKRKPTTNAGQIFKQSANSLLQSKNNSLGAFGKKLRARRGSGIAVKAVARKLAELYYYLFTEGEEYVEIGFQKYEQQYQEKQKLYLAKKARELNLQLVEI